jgi:hypothetical protein
MRLLAVTLAVLAVCLTAQAGYNTCVRLYIDFDPPNYVHSRGELEPYSTIRVFLCADCLGVNGQGDVGFSSISFRLAVSPEVSDTVEFTNYLSSST